MSTPPPAVEDTPCPRCGAPIGPAQAWCLACGAPARTRVVPTPRWRVPVIVVGAVVVVALGALAGAFVVGTRGGTEPVAPMTEPPSPGASTATTPATTPPPATAAAPPATTPPATAAPATTPPASTAATVPPATAVPGDAVPGDADDATP